MILAFIRTGTAISLMPFFGYMAVPPQVKIALSFVLAVVLAPTAAMSIPATMTGVLPIAAAAVSEAIVGLAIGATTLLILMSADFAGTLIGLQMGFSSVTLFDPQAGEEVSIIGRLESMLALIIFISLDGHHMLLNALGGSFSSIPLGGGVFTGQSALLFGRLTAEVFVIAVKLAAPVLAILLLTEIAMGFVSRAMPQMNVFADSFPLKIGIGLISMAVTWPLFVYVLSKSFNLYGKSLTQLIGMMGP